MSMVVDEIQVPPVVAQQVIEPEFIRLPKVGQCCPRTGLKRSVINNLILPCEANGNRPPVKSCVLRQPVSRAGVRLIVWKSLRDYILSNLECSSV